MTDEDGMGLRMVMKLKVRMICRTWMIVGAGMIVEE